MTWIGKFGGGILGLIAGGPVGAVIGTALGHQFDRGAGAGFDAPHLDEPGHARSLSAAQRQQLLVETTFLAMGYLAKADGRVCESEIRAARQLMVRMGLEPPEVQHAIACFTRGKQPGGAVFGRVRTLRAACSRDPELLRIFMELQLGFLLEKGGIGIAERGGVLRLAGAAGIPPVEFMRMEATVRARRSFRERRGPGQPERSLSDAYRILGLDGRASEADVTRAYRRLMNRHHPDKQAGRGVSDTMLEQAKTRTREIRWAYERIRGHRRRH